MEIHIEKQWRRIQEKTVRDQKKGEEAGREKGIIEEILEGPDHQKGEILENQEPLIEEILEDRGPQTGGILGDLLEGNLEGVSPEVLKTLIIRKDGSIRKTDIKEDIPDPVAETEVDVIGVLKGGYDGRD